MSNTVGWILYFFTAMIIAGVISAVYCIVDKTTPREALEDFWEYLQDDQALGVLSVAGAVLAFTMLPVLLAAALAAGLLLLIVIGPVYGISKLIYWGYNELTNPKENV